MKRNRIFVLGLAIGLIFAFSIQAFAAPVLQKIEAYINPGITFQFDGVKKELSSDYRVLIYQDRTYVPVRFVAENLGATVAWDSQTQKITVTSAAINVTPDMPKADDAVYTKLPYYTSTLKYNFTASVLMKDTEGYKVFCTLENKGDYPIQLDQTATKIVVDGKEFFMTEVAVQNLDKRWFSDIAKDKKTEGYIQLPKAIYDYAPEKIHLEVKIRTNTANAKEPETVIVNFPVK